MTETNSVWAKCRQCGHVWPAVQLPMLIEKAAQALASAKCLECGDKRPFVANKSDIPAQRQSASGVPLIRRAS